MAATPCEVGRAGTTSPILKRFQIIKDVQCDNGRSPGFMVVLLSGFLKYFSKPCCDRWSSKMATIYYFHCCRSISSSHPAPLLESGVALCLVLTSRMQRSVAWQALRGQAASLFPLRSQISGM